MKQITRILLFATLLLTLFVGCDDDDTITEPVQTESNFDLYVNEIMPKNAITIKDENGIANDWFEIYNAAGETVNLNGFTLKYEYEDAGTPFSFNYVITEDILIEAGGFKVFWCDETGTGTHTNFELKAKKGGAVSIIDTETFVVDKFDYSQTEATLGVDDLSVARYPDGSETIKAFGTGYELWATPGLSNSTIIAPPSAPKVFINELMVKNETTIQDPNALYSDWIEFYNESDTEINLKDWTVRYKYEDGGVVDSTDYTFTNGFKVPAGGWKLLWCEGTGSGDFANFDMKAKKGGVISLMDASGNLIDFIDYNGTDLTDGTADRSYGRKNNGGGTWVMFGTGYDNMPTPNASNK